MGKERAALNEDIVPIRDHESVQRIPRPHQQRRPRRQLAHVHGPNGVDEVDEAIHECANRVRARIIPSECAPREYVATNGR